MSISEGSSVRIREVWTHNLHEEFLIIKSIAQNFPFLSIDTEFPGTVVSLTGYFRSPSDFQYQTLRANVDATKLIQLGFTFTDDKGHLPRCQSGEYCVWQFNFKDFNDKSDLHAVDSIELLRRCGIDFRKNREKGIDSRTFSKLLMSSGLVLNENMHYICFHGGYDFGYLLKILTGKKLPALQEEFYSELYTYFGLIYDVKYMMKFSINLYGGLEKLARSLKVKRFGASHQAGSDSLLTSSTFQKLKDTFFNGSTEEYSGVLYGLDIDDAQTIQYSSPEQYPSALYGLGSAEEYPTKEYGTEEYSGVQYGLGIDDAQTIPYGSPEEYSSALYGLGLDHACVYQQVIYT